jgi:flagellar protein FliJ
VPRFRFELQAVLDHRERQEREHQRIVAELERHRVSLENIIRACQEGLNHEREHMRSMLAGADMRGARQQVAAAARLSTQAQRAVLELAGLHKRLDAARVALLESTKRRKAVELLKERRFEEWTHVQNKKEAEAVDEIAVMRAARGDQAP